MGSHPTLGRLSISVQCDDIDLSPLLSQLTRTVGSDSMVLCWLGFLAKEKIPQSFWVSGQFVGCTDAAVVLLKF